MRDNKIKTMKLQYRINELEEILCPTHSHDWKKIAVKDYHTSNGDVQTETEYMCTKCKKVVRL